MVRTCKRQTFTNKWEGDTVRRYELEIENLQASDGWLDRWKKHNFISFKVVTGESTSVSEEMIAPGAETTVPTILSQFKAEDIYNVD